MFLSVHPALRDVHQVSYTHHNVFPDRTDTDPNLKNAFFFPSPLFLLASFCLLALFYGNYEFIIAMCFLYVNEFD
jgi:hypothetical protein